MSTKSKTRTLQTETNDGFAIIQTYIVRKVYPEWVRYKGAIPQEILRQLDLAGDWPRGVAEATVKRLNRNKKLRIQLAEYRERNHGTRMNQQHDIYVRAHTVQREVDDDKRATYDNEPTWPDYALVWDPESRVTADQTLTFGFWRFCELRSGIYVATEEGILHDNGISGKEIALLRRFARTSEADTTEDGYNRIRVYSHSKFIAEVFGMAIQAKAFIVGFNCGFDLSRIALDWGPAENGGWSLVLSRWRNPETGELEPNKFFPRVVIKALNSKTSIIHSTRAPMSEPKKKGDKVKLWPAARFLDVRTLLWALRNRSYSLRSPCKEFKTKHQKINHTPTGKVTHEEIEYARNDVSCTVDLLNAAKREFDLHPIAPGPDRMFSPASVAKSYLDELHISHPSEKVK